MKKTEKVLLTAVVFSTVTFAFTPQTAKAADLPRFVSTKSNEVNLRTGPDTKYPIEWVYKKSGLPLEVVQELGNWRKVKDWDGTTGWIIKSGLSSKRRSFRALGKAPLRRGESEDSVVFAEIGAGAVGKILQCPVTNLSTCRVEIQGYQGWVDKGDIWGVYAQESVD